ncbi:MAG TPA: hypothetical protein VL327_03220 [Pyrinomonadaceae bacterium]|jgi:hypothetical protein|nr:hypothetical protein [Pyrinomonadaceae bacterium]
MHSRAIFSGVFLVFGTALAVSLMPQQALSQAQVKPIYSEYKGVSIGTKADDARAKLGAPKDKSDTQDYYVFSDNESAQVLYDTDHTVRVISINYIGKLDTAPTPKAVFGSEVTANSDGSVNKMVKYPKAGFWISYYKTGGDDPMIVLTLQKMNHDEQ